MFMIQSHIIRVAESGMGRRGDAEVAGERFVEVPPARVAHLVVENQQRVAGPALDHLHGGACEFYGTFGPSLCGCCQMCRSYRSGQSKRSRKRAFMRCGAL